MLGRNTYTREELDRGRKSIRVQLAAHKKLAKFADGGRDKKVISALDGFDAVFFNNLALALDRPFVHRVRSVSGKDGNALNELEIIVESLVNNDGVLTPGNVIKFVPDASITKLQVGDRIQLRADQFERLAEAFFAEIEAKFL